jgi:hypothetical protein
MKITIVMKDPDGVWDSLEQAGLNPNDLPQDVKRCVESYFEYGEYLRVEIDTETEDIEVLRN